ncbi:MAG: hypothetical protein U9Q33_10300 [Campylobacterota bacterium]|nr:hypothetical protein [Campylobacterota bacterium]
MNLYCKIFIYFFFSFSLLYGAKENKTLESQPQILFEYDKLLSSQEKRELLVKFNTGVLFLEQKKYKQAIAMFKESSKLIKIASFLNIGIAYYKLNSYKNAYLYLKKIFDFKELIDNDKYSYFSSAYYLYKITKDLNYINEISKISAKAKRLSEYEKMLVVDILIIQKKYKYALDMLKTTKHGSSLKKALLNMKLRDYTQAKIDLNVAYDKSAGTKDKNTILWFMVYRDLKANDLTNLNDDLARIEKRKKRFDINKKLQLELYFNKEKYVPKEYYDFITKFTMDRKIDFIYYFAPFIFEDYDSMLIDEAKGFIIKDKNNLSELNTMIKYNADFLKVIKLDPVIRVKVLKEMIDAKYDANAYEYYNLALNYAQIYDYNNAYKYFKKAYSLDHGNKLYSLMTLLTAKKIDLKIDKLEKKFMEKNLRSSKGSYKYLAKYAYKIIVDPSIKLNPDTLSVSQKRSVFFRSLYFLENVENNGIRASEPLLVEFSKDPLVNMLKRIAREEGENDYLYISRIQDSLPKVFNHSFITGSFVISDFYLDTLQALGLFNRTDFNIDNYFEPSYLRTKALVQLFNDNPKAAVKIIEYLQKNYNLESVDSYYILAASYLGSKDKEMAYVTLSELELIYNDNDAKYLNGTVLIQQLKLNNIEQYYKKKLKGKLIDFKINNYDEFMESL